MDSVRAILEESQDVGALVTCGFFYISGHYTEPNCSGDLRGVHHEIARVARIELRRAVGLDGVSGQPFAVTGN
jgi:hypothetical protein